MQKCGEDALHSLRCIGKMHRDQVHVKQKMHVKRCGVGCTCGALLPLRLRVLGWGGVCAKKMHVVDAYRLAQKGELS